VNSNGGTAPHDYSIDGGATFQPSNCFTNLAAGTYPVLVRDANGCNQVIPVSITQPPQLSIIFNSPLLVCFTDTVQVCANPTGGIAPYSSYLWSPGGITTPCATYTPVSPGTNTFTVTVQDSAGCSVTDSISVFVPPHLAININSIPPSCGQCDGIAVASGGAVYTWMPGGINFPGLTGACAATLYTVTVVDVNGCSDTSGVYFPAQCDSVWPGDANLDGVADNNDVLALGISYGATGPVRPGATNAWTPQVAPNWSSALAGGINYKHSDCDGNGTVDAADTIPIYLNYGLTHLHVMQPVHDASIPDLSLETMADTTGPHEHLFVKVHLGSSSMPVSAIYGLAFRINFDPLLVDTNSFSFNYAFSGLGVPGFNLLTFQYPFYSSGAIDVALTRTNQSNAVNFDSLVLVMDVVITDNVSALDVLRLGISNVRAITLSETPVALNEIGDSVVVDPLFVGIQSPNQENLVSVYPSPVADQLHVFSFVDIERATLFNELGEKVFNQPVHQKIFSIETGTIKNGMYFLQLTTSAGLLRKRICVMR